MGKMKIVRKLIKISRELDKNPDLEEKMKPFVKKYDISDPSNINMKVAKMFIKEYERVVAENG